MTSSLEMRSSEVSLYIMIAQSSRLTDTVIVSDFSPLARVKAIKTTFRTDRRLIDLVFSVI